MSALVLIRVKTGGRRDAGALALRCFGNTRPQFTVNTTSSKSKFLSCSYLPHYHQTASTYENELQRMKAPFGFNKIAPQHVEC